MTVWAIKQVACVNDFAYKSAIKKFKSTLFREGLYERLFAIIRNVLYLCRLLKYTPYF